MCGIFGWNSAKLNFDNAKKFQIKLNHRGPDSQDIFTFNNITIGHNRLSIIDNSILAKQPMVDASENFVIVFNGEVYNYQEIKKQLIEKGYIFKSNSDTEVVLYSYIEWYEDCVHKLRGMFAFAIFEKRTNKIFLARDRFGIKPLMYFINNDHFIFSSELSPFLDIEFIEKRINLDSVIDFFKYGSVKQPKSIICNIKSLMPGSYMVIEQDLNYKITKYYNLSEKSKIIESYKYEDYCDELRFKLNEATRLHMISDFEVGSYLSGGIDSTIVTALMQSQSTKQIKTFCIGFEKNDYNNNDESALAQETSTYLGTNHTNIILSNDYVLQNIDGFINSIDQPTSDGINTYFVSKESSKQVKVALSGLGGDELFYGYNLYEDLYLNHKKNINIFSKFFVSIENIYSNKFTRNILLQDISTQKGIDILRPNKKVKNNFSNAIKYKNLNNENVNLNLNFDQSIIKSEFDGYLLNTLLRDCDNFSMANSQELRPILLDHELVEFAIKIPLKFKRNDFKGKKIFTDSVYDIIPKHILNKKKYGFNMPNVIWMNGILNKRFKNLLTQYFNNNLFSINYFKEVFLRICNQKAINEDWMLFIFLEWVQKNKISI